MPRHCVTISLGYDWRFKMESPDYYERSLFRLSAVALRQRLTRNSQKPLPSADIAHRQHQSRLRMQERFTAGDPVQMGLEHPQVAIVITGNRRRIVLQ